MGGEAGLQSERLRELGEEGLLGLARRVRAVDCRRIDLRGELLRATDTRCDIGRSRWMREIAVKTGGDTLNTADAAEGLHEMIHRLRSRYSLYYVLPRGKAGEERKIKVQLTPDAARRFPGATVRARNGYVAPGAVERH